MQLTASCCIATGRFLMLCFLQTSVKGDVTADSVCNRMINCCDFWPSRSQWNIDHRPLFSIFICALCCCLHLLPAVLVSCYPHLLLHISLPCVLWSSSSEAMWNFHSACLAMLSSHLHRVFPSHVHFLHCIWFSIGSCLVLLHNLIAIPCMQTLLLFGSHVISIHCHV